MPLIQWQYWNIICVLCRGSIIFLCVRMKCLSLLCNDECPFVAIFNVNWWYWHASNVRPYPLFTMTTLRHPKMMYINYNVCLDIITNISRTNPLRAIKNLFRFGLRQVTFFTFNYSNIQVVRIEWIEKP